MDESCAQSLGQSATGCTNGYLIQEVSVCFTALKDTGCWYEYKMLQQATNCTSTVQIIDYIQIKQKRKGFNICLTLDYCFVTCQVDNTFTQKD